MIMRDYEETYDPFLFFKPQQKTILLHFLIFLFNPVNNPGSRERPSFDGLSVTVSVGCFSIV